MNTAELDPDTLIEQEIAAAQARGEDPYADKAPAAPTAPEGADDALDVNALAEIAGEDAGQAAAEQPAEQPAETPAATEQPAAKPAEPAPYRAELPADLDTKRTALITEKADALAKLMSGELEPQEYAELEVRVTTELEALSRAQARAETLAAINQQTAAQSQGKVIAQIVEATKSVLDYTKDAGAQRQFDTAMQMLAADPDNAGKSFADLANQANRTVLALRGLQVTTKGGKADAPKRDVPTPPVTLGGLPAAATAGSKSAGQALAALSGEDFERAYDQLPSEERAKLLR